MSKLKKYILFSILYVIMFSCIGLNKIAVTIKDIKINKRERTEGRPTT